MSEKKVSSFDWAAMSVAAFFVVSLLAIRPIGNFIDANGNTGSGGTPKPWHVIEWLTLGVLVIQAWILVRQAGISDKQATLTHQTYLMANRPRLGIRNVVVHRTQGGHRDDNASLFEDSQIIGQCFITNTGGTNAYTVESHLIVFANQMGLPMERPYETHLPNSPVGQIKIEAGRSYPIPFREANPLVTGTGEPGRARAGEHPIFVMGWISYSDDNGVTRRTAFCRQWNASKCRFVRLDDDPDYEHE